MGSQRRTGTTWPDDGEASSSRKPFLEHLEDLRRTVLWCGAALLLGMALAAPLSPWVLRLLKRPVAQAGLDADSFLRVLQLTSGLSVVLRIVFWGGLLLSLPAVVAVTARFVMPGLTPRERTAARRGLAAGAALFAGGVGMGYRMVLPPVIRLMVGINRWIGIRCEFVELSGYTAFVLKLLIAFGLAFELPVLIVALGSVGIVNSRQLRDKRRHVIVGLFVAAMLLTPPDPLSQVLMAVPLVVLYEACIWIVRAGERTRERAS